MTPLSAITALKALDALTLRASVTAQNIANAGTPGYRPMTVRFEQALAAAAAGGQASTVAALRPTITAAASPDLRIDLEMATASADQLRYAGLVEVLNRQLQLRALGAKGNV